MDRIEQAIADLNGTMFPQVNSKIKEMAGQSLETTFARKIEIAWNADISSTSGTFSKKIPFSFNDIDKQKTVSAPLMGLGRLKNSWVFILHVMRKDGDDICIMMN